MADTRLGAVVELIEYLTAALSNVAVVIGEVDADVVPLEAVEAVVAAEREIARAITHLTSVVWSACDG